MPPSSILSDNQSLEAMVNRTLADEHLLDAGDRVLVGVSGGPDSMVLLHVLNRLAMELDIRLGVAHLNHGLRDAQADYDAHTVRQTATRLGLPHHIVKARVIAVKQGLGLSLEEAGRRVRYAFFQKIMIDGGYNKLALGHHLNDNAEQMLMAIFRGSGPKGLSGIPPCRQRRIVRPLIKVSRPQIEAYAKQKGIVFVTDASNQDPRFMRNRIRHRLMPLLAAEYNPRIEKQLSQLAETMRLEDEWIESLVVPYYSDALSHRGKDRLSFRIDALKRMHPALLRRCLRRGLLELTGTLRRISFAHIQSIQPLLEEGMDGKTIHLPDGGRARRNQTRLDLVRVAHYRRQANRQTKQPLTMAPIVIQGPFPCQMEVESLGIGIRFAVREANALVGWREAGPNQAFFDLEQLTQPLVLRHKLPGDRFVPLGATGSQKIKKFFIDHHVPPRVRAKAPILADQRRIIWLVGWRIDDRVKITPETVNVLCADFFLLDTQ